MNEPAPRALWFLAGFIRVFRLTYTRAVLYEFNINIKTDKKSYFLD